MTDDADGLPEAQFLIKTLRKSTEDLQASVARLEPPTASIRPSAECWSPLEIIEHVAIVDTLFGSRIRNGELLTTPLIDSGREAGLLEGLARRTNRITAPSFTQPTGRYASLDEAMEAVRAGRVRIEAHILKNGATLRYRKVMHPIIGELSAYEAYLVLAGHATRHARQIEEIQQATHHGSPAY